MTHPAVYLLGIGVAVGIALYAFFANAPEYQRSQPHRTNSNKSHHDGDYVDNSKMCTICITNISSDMAYLDCGHAFHRACVRRWLNTKDTCPNCLQVQQTRI